MPTPRPRREPMPLSLLQPEARTLFELAELNVDAAVQWLRLIVEAVGAAVIGLGVAIGVVQFARSSFHRTPDGYNGIRLTVARYLAVALEFQLAADLLSTAVAPTWAAIGKLAAIAAVRTGLNYFLGREIREERREEAERTGRAPPS